MKNFSFTTSCNGALGTLAGSTIETIKKSGISSIIEHPKYLTLVQVTDNFRTALVKKRNSDFQVAFQETGEALNSSFMGLSLSIRMLTYSSSPSEKETGEKINQRLNSFGRCLAKQKLSNKSPYLHSVINEFSKADYVSFSSLKPWVEDLKSALIKFDQMMVSKDNDQLDLKNVTSATSLRTPLIDALRSVYEYVYGMSITTDKQEWSNLYDQLMYSFGKQNRSNLRAKPNVTDNAIIAENKDSAQAV